MSILSSAEKGESLPENYKHCNPGWPHKHALSRISLYLFKLSITWPTYPNYTESVVQAAFLIIAQILNQTSLSCMLCPMSVILVLVQPGSSSSAPAVEGPLLVLAHRVRLAFPQSKATLGNMAGWHSERFHIHNPWKCDHVSTISRLHYSWTQRSRHPPVHIQMGPSQAGIINSALKS